MKLTDIQVAAADIGGPISPERALWLSVINLAVRDALGRSGRVEYRRDGAVVYDAHDEALAWFSEAGEDFYTICDLAGIDADALREAVLSERVPDPALVAKPRKLGPLAAPSRPKRQVAHRCRVTERTPRRRPLLTDDERRQRTRERNRRSYLSRKAGRAMQA
ncbi:hypothetical protein GAY31_19235 [Azospirillum brasilense]|nr:hypothetical protein [Azospirillum brasilense]